MSSAVLEIAELPASSLDAASAFHADHLADARAILEAPDTTVLVIHLPQADKSHDDWRRALARDLARAYAPKRVNVIGASQEGAEDLLTYLLDAPGVTGQYCPADD